MAEDAYLNFRQMISAAIIKGAYFLGACLITGVSFLWLAYPFVAHYATTSDEPMPYTTGFHIAGAVCLLVFGNLFWRLLCEGWILLFSVHEILASIEKNSDRTAELLETVSRQLAAVEENTEQRHSELLTLSRKPSPALSISNEPSA